MTVKRQTPREREEDLQERVDEAEGRKIPIANLYHLLCYAWEFFELDEEVRVDVDNHNGYAELLTKVLTAGTVHLLKQGLHRDYQPVTEPMRAIRGKLELASSLATGKLEQGIAVCTHDEFTADIPANQILKSVLIRMARTSGMDADLGSAARSIALRMTGVALIEPDVRMLGRVRIHRNNRFYGFLLSICRLILEATSVKESRDTLAVLNQRFYGAVEERLPALFEAFVRNFYRDRLRSHGFSRFDAQHIEWLWNPLTEKSRSYLPKMITDITLEHPDRKIILDTKFYQSGGINDRQTFESANLYQLHAYVSQLARHAQGIQGNSNSRPHPHDDRAEGMLLYATVGENNYVHRFAMPPHKMTVATVDLNLPWQGIEQQLLDLILTQPQS